MKCVVCLSIPLIKGCSSVGFLVGGSVQISLKIQDGMLTAVPGQGWRLTLCSSNRYYDS